MRFAVMGNPITHSLSPVIHQHFAKSLGITLCYERIEVTLDLEKHVHQFFKAGGKGLNITAPYKEEAFHLSNVQTPRCLKAKSANTLWMKDNLLCADNTDGIGFCRSVNQHLNLKNTQVLIIGCGGAAKGIIPALLDHGANVTLTNRTLSKAHDLQVLYSGHLASISFTDTMHQFDIVINASSLNLDASQLPSQWFSNAILCNDLAYHVSGETPFTTWVKSQSCLAKDGYDMLVEQAAEAFYIWHGIMPSVKDILGNKRLNK